MWVLYKKEISGFFSTLTGYIVVIVFLLAISLFMWVLPGQFNVLDAGYATMDPMFQLAPWVFLFLVPAVTMRLFAEEKRTGTIETLLTRPLSDLQIIMAKYLAGLTLVVLALLPTLVFFYSLTLLGNPPGNIDFGGTWGAYLGLLFLSGIYVAIGIFSSSLTDNQIIAFIFSAVLIFIFYLGFSSLSYLGIFSGADHLLAQLSIDTHYESISRGVVDSRDLVYFIAVIAVFIASTQTVLESRKW